MKQEMTELRQVSWQAGDAEAEGGGEGRRLKREEGEVNRLGPNGQAPKADEK
jgi:hypothetical protein